MTPHFTTPCFVRIEDADKRKEIIKALVEMRGDPVCVTDDTYYPILCEVDYWFDFNMSKTNPKYLLNYINCGTNTELFLALAGMREDIDKGQWFTDGEIMWQCPYDKFTGRVYLSSECPQFEPDKIRRATAAEIIEHFNNK